MLDAKAFLCDKKVASELLFSFNEVDRHLLFGSMKAWGPGLRKEEYDMTYVGVGAQWQPYIQGITTLTSRRPVISLLSSRSPTSSLYLLHKGILASNSYLNPSCYRTFSHYGDMKLFIGAVSVDGAQL